MSISSTRLTVCQERRQGLNMYPKTYYAVGNNKTLINACLMNVSPFLALFTSSRQKDVIYSLPPVNEGVLNFRVQE